MLLKIPIGRRKKFSENYRHLKNVFQPCSRNYVLMESDRSSPCYRYVSTVITPNTHSEEPHNSSEKCHIAQRSFSTHQPCITSVGRVIQYRCRLSWMFNKQNQNMNYIRSRPLYSLVKTGRMFTNTVTACGMRRTCLGHLKG